MACAQLTLSFNDVLGRLCTDLANTLVNHAFVTYVASSLQIQSRYTFHTWGLGVSRFSLVVKIASVASSYGFMSFKGPEFALC